MWQSTDSQNVVWVLRPVAKGSYRGAKVTLHIKGTKAGDEKLEVLKSNVTN